METSEPENYIRWTTDDKVLLEDEDYRTVITIVHDLWNSGTIRRGTGHCYSMSDIVAKLLKYNGVDCYLEECSLMILKKDPPELHMVGYPGADQKNPMETIQTHIVCITKTKNPILIDLSISNFIEGIPYICERIVAHNNIEIANFDFSNSSFKYSRRSHTQIPLLHQQSIVNRIQTDKKLFSSINKINKILILVSIITSLNFIRGIYDFNQKYIIKDNGFGPTPKLFVQ